LHSGVQSTVGCLGKNGMSPQPQPATLTKVPPLSSITISLMVLLCLFGASLFGMLLRRNLPDHHLSSDTKDSVKLAMGLVATMAALVLGLLIAAAKDKYDKEAAGVTQMAAKVIFLDRLLATYGPETKDLRDLLKQAVGRIADHMWPTNSGSET